MDTQSVQLFEYEQHTVRVAFIEDKPWWVARDVCNVLELDDVNKALIRLDDDEKDTNLIRTPGGPQKMAIVNEPGLYSLILGSRKPEAKAFKRWITHEVLPAIRQQGLYISPNANPLKVAEAAKEYIIKYMEAEKARQAEIEARIQAEAQLSLVAPKVEVYDMLAAATNVKKIGTIAKSLGWNPNKFFDQLRQDGILMSTPDENWNVPYQQYIDQGYFVTHEYPIVKKNGEIITKTLTKATAKGEIWLCKRYGKRRAA